MSNTEKNTKKAGSFIVCGYGRSGTSLTARLLHENGIPMGYKLKSRNNFNRYGYFEDYGIIYACMEHAEAPWLDKQKKAIKVRAKQARTLEEIIKLYKKPRWGFKMVGWMVDAWDEIQKHVHNPHLLVCKRDKEKQVLSIRRALNKEPKEQILKKMNDVYDKIDKIDCPKLELDFDDWFNNTEVQLKRFCEFTDIDYSKELINFIDNNEKHF